MIYGKSSEERETVPTLRSIYTLTYICIHTTYLSIFYVSRSGLALLSPKLSSILPLLLHILYIHIYNTIYTTIYIYIYLLASYPGDVHITAHYNWTILVCTIYECNCSPCQVKELIIFLFFPPQSSPAFFWYISNFRLILNIQTTS